MITPSPTATSILHSNEHGALLSLLISRSLLSNKLLSPRDESRIARVGNARRITWSNAQPSRVARSITPSPTIALTMNHYQSPIAQSG